MLASSDSGVVKRMTHILLSLILGYAVICLVLFFRQDGMIFFPQRGTAESLDRLAAAERFEPWLDQRGERIGWRSLDGDSHDAVVVFHGNAGHALHRTFYRDALRAGGDRARVFLLEYPGYGARDGRPSERSLTDAGRQAVVELAAQPGLRVRVIGESLGSGVACSVAAQVPEKISGVILITPFNSLIGAASFHYPWLPVRVFLRTRFASDQHLAKFEGPVAFILAEQDSVIPAKLGERLFENYHGRKQLWRSAGEHNDTPVLLANWPAIRRWMDRN